MPGRDGRSGGLRTGGCAEDRAQAVRRDLLSRPRPARAVSITGDPAGLCPRGDPRRCRPESRRAACFRHMPMFSGTYRQVPRLRRGPACLGRGRPSGPRASLSLSSCRTLGSSMGHHAPSVREPACCLGPDYPCSVPAPGPSSGSRLKLPVQWFWGDSWTPPAGSESRAPR